MSFDSQVADKFAKVISEAHQTGDFQTMVDNIPYAQFIGLKFQRLGQDILFHLPANPDNIGNPILPADRKSTRLNSSHVRISYAVFCLKKKKKKYKKQKQ